MARTDVSVQSVSDAGATLTYTAAIADGHMFVNTGIEFLHIRNNDVASKTITLQTPQQVSGLDVDERTIVVAAGAQAMVGNLPTGLYNQSGTDANKVYVDYSAITSVRIAVFS